MIDWQWQIVDDLESSYRWREAKEFMLKAWEETHDNIKACVRLAFICWYTLAEWEIPWLDKVDVPGYEECIIILKRLLSYGMEHFMGDVDFLWTFGYMISLFPEFWGMEYVGHKYEEWEHKGEQMIEKAGTLAADDPMLTMLLLGGLINRSEDQQANYEKACRATQPLLTLRFTGKGEMQRYFGSVLSRDKNAL